MLRNPITLSVICLLCAGIGLGCLPNSSKVKNRLQTSDDIDAVVTNNLTQIYYSLLDEVESGDHFTWSFSNLNSQASHLGVFVSPGSGSVPDSLNTVEKWSDFIYVGNLEDVVPSAAMIISPPENHQGKYGYVMLVGGRLIRLPADQVRAIVSDPCLTATNTLQAKIDLLKQRLTLRVPDRLQRYYPIPRRESPK
jgi:hypothetical protein